MLRLHMAPAASEKLLVQSAGVPLPDVGVKLLPTERPGPEAVNGALPIFWICTDIGLSLLVAPTAVEA